MRTLEGEELREAKRFVEEAAEAAQESGCDDAWCGSVLIGGDEIIGKGWNSPPHDLESHRRCSNEKEEYDERVTDKTCCVHAEQRAIMNALGNYSKEKVKGSKLYFARVNEQGKVKKTNEPYCTICSKMILDVGIEEVVMWNGEDLVAYPAEEYNDISFSYQG
ncbi:MAG: hypothetical protein ACLFTQ_03400 [Candidatus Aenigmatarchaeota archaeon]